MIKEFSIKVSPSVAVDEENILNFLAKEKGINISEVTGIKVTKHSIDARQKNIAINLTLETYINEAFKPDFFKPIDYKFVSSNKQVIIVGAGPAGLFAALRLVELGIKPIIIERGKTVHDRKLDIANISKFQNVNSESNYCFGEGGAGAFSDGKLYTRSKKRGDVNRILSTFCQFGASLSILSDAHPHIGTDKLPRVIENIRKNIISCGGEVYFETKMTDIIIKNNSVVGIRTESKSTETDSCIKTKEFLGQVILATGHSARDIYKLLYNKDIKIQAKSLAVGVRLEHSQKLIDQIQYHNKKGRGDFLPAAEYRVVTQINGRGVYSFCMCPGGVVVPAASGPNQVVVNGMSSSARSSRWANAGLVVEIHPEDLVLPEYNFKDASFSYDGIPQELRMIHFLEKYEELSFINGGKSQVAPSQRMVDFVNNKLSLDLPMSSYSPGVTSSNLKDWIPTGISSRLSDGFEIFGKNKKGFLTNEALMIGVESRTSSPVRIIRDRESLEHVEIKGLYPCGEGAGYAGGIVSAAIDGVRCADKINDK